MNLGTYRLEIGPKDSTGASTYLTSKQLFDATKNRRTYVKIGPKSAFHELFKNVGFKNLFLDFEILKIDFYGLFYF